MWRLIRDLHDVSVTLPHRCLPVFAVYCVNMFGVQQDTSLRGQLFARYWNDPLIYSDCYTKVVNGHISLGEYVSALYGSRVFRLELLIFKFTLGLNVSPADIQALANGGDSFAVWDVEDRSEDQLLLKDRHGSTRSWLMVSPEGGKTRLFFGSAVLPGDNGKQGMMFQLALPFHKVYAQSLLAAVRL